MTRKTPPVTDSTEGTVRSMDGLTRSVDAFSRMIDRLQQDYAELEARHASLNAELSEVNEHLRQAAGENQKLASYLDQVVAAATVGIIAVDGDGVVRLFNATAADLLGLPSGAVLNRPYGEVWPERDGRTDTALACLRGAQPVANVRREISRESAAPLVLSVSTVRMDAPGNGDAAAGDLCHGAMEVFSDLTRIESMNREMTHMRTLAALGEMSATIAHEIRNPLGGIIGFADLLARRTEDGSEQKEMVSKILSGAQHLNKVVNRLLDFARGPRVEKRPLQWNTFLESTMDQYEDSARRRGVSLTLVRNWPESMPAGSADGLCLRQALWNILENAEHATDGKGRVELTARLRKDGWLQLRVIDNGRGISPDVMGQVFSPFVTTKKKGTGLGLATARKMIEAHGGAISIESTEGVGTTVHVELPAAVGEG